MFSVPTEELNNFFDEFMAEAQTNAASSSKKTKSKGKKKGKYIERDVPQDQGTKRKYTKDVFDIEEKFKKPKKKETPDSSRVIKLPPAPTKKSERLVKLTASDIQILKTIPKNILMQLNGVSVPAVKRFVAWIKYRKIMALDDQKRNKALLDGAITFKKNDNTIFNQKTMKTEKK